MTMTKPVAVILKDEKYLVARDKGENFFKNVGGRIHDDETEIECLKRNLQSEIGISLITDPELIFEFPPTPAVGDPGDVVILKGYLIEEAPSEFVPQGDIEELAWVDSLNAQDFKITPQIKELIIPKLVELELIQ